MFFRVLLLLIVSVIMGTVHKEMEELFERLFRRKLASYEESLQFLDDKYETLQGKVTKLEEENKSLRVENNTLKNQLMSIADNLKLENNALKSQINTIVNVTKNHEAILDELELYSRRECIEIKGIPMIEDEDTNDNVCQVAELMNIQIEDADISVSQIAARQTLDRQQWYFAST